MFYHRRRKYFSGDYLNKLIERYGSRENILKYYITYRAKNFLFKDIQFQKSGKFFF